MAMEFWFWIRVFGPGVGTSSMHCSLNCPFFWGAFVVLDLLSWTCLCVFRLADSEIVTCLQGCLQHVRCSSKSDQARGNNG